MKEMKEMKEADPELEGCGESVDGEFEDLNYYAQPRRLRRIIVTFN